MSVCLFCTRSKPAPDEADAEHARVRSGPHASEGSALANGSRSKVSPDATPRLSPGENSSRSEEHRHASPRSILGIEGIHLSFARHSKLSPLRRRRMTAEQLHAEEETALQVFKDLLSQKGVEIPLHMRYAGDLDATLLRFLRARKYNIEKSFEMICDCIAWREKNNVETILERPFDPEKLRLIRDNSHSGYYGYDKKGQPVYIDRPGKLNIQKLLSSDITTDDILFKHVQEMEYLSNVILWEASERAGHTIDSCLMILDVGGVKLTDFTKEVKNILHMITKVDQDNYPETNGGTLVVNSSFIFVAIFRVVEAFLDKRTREKIKLFGADKKGRAKLLQHVDADQLPQFLGGTAPDEVLIPSPGKTIPSHSAMDEYIANRCKHSKLLSATKEKQHRATPDLATAVETEETGQYNSWNPPEGVSEDLLISKEILDALASADLVLEQINKLRDEDVERIKVHSLSSANGPLPSSKGMQNSKGLPKNNLSGQRRETRCCCVQ